MDWPCPPDLGNVSTGLGNVFTDLGNVRTALGKVCTDLCNECTDHGFVVNGTMFTGFGYVCVLALSICVCYF